MLRRRDDHTFESRRIELVLGAAAASYLPLSADRRDLIHYRILLKLGVQEMPEPFYAPIFRDRWVSLPVAAVGLAAALIAANRFISDDTDGGDTTTYAQAAGQLTVDGRAVSALQPGVQATAASPTWLSLKDDVQVGLEAGTTVSYEDRDGMLHVRFGSGKLTVVSKSRAVSLMHGDQWAASLDSGTVADFVVSDGGSVVNVSEGRVAVTVNGINFIVTPGNSPLYIPAGGSGPDAGNSGGQGQGQGEGGGNQGEGQGTGGASPADSPGNGNPPQDPGQGGGSQQNNGQGKQPGDDPPGDGTGGSPEDSPSTNGNGNGNGSSEPGDPGGNGGNGGGPPEDSGPSEGQGQPDPPDDPGLPDAPPGNGNGGNNGTGNGPDGGSASDGNGPEGSSGPNGNGNAQPGSSQESVVVSPGSSHGGSRR